MKLIIHLFVFTLLILISPLALSFRVISFLVTRKLLWVTIFIL